MRTLSLAVFLLLFQLSVFAQGVPGDFELAQRFADSGAWKAALARVEAQQPVTVSAPRWADWEQLRCNLMFRLSQPDALAKRITEIPSGAPPVTLRFCLLQGARAAIVAAQGQAAREFLSQFFWRNDVPAEELRQARLLVIDAYLVDDRTREAYLLMLRYQQDYKPLDRDTAARFVEGLLAGGMDKEAVNWMAQLDDAGPVKLLLRLQTGLLTPDAAVEQARAAIAKRNAPPAYWDVMQFAATTQRNNLLRVEAMEHRLHLASAKSASVTAALAEDLWRTYALAAQELANQEKLLVGDDSAWSDFGARRAAASATAGRAIFAFLVMNSKVPATRANAQLQLVYSLQSSKLSMTALRLFADASRFQVKDIDTQARYLLGAMAAENNRQELAARYWSGLDAPPQLDADEWSLRLAQSLAAAGLPPASADILRAMLTGKKTLSVALMRRVMAVVVEIQEAGQTKSADTLYRALLPLAASRERRELLYALGRGAETAADHARAADHFLEAALTLDQPVPDALAVNARLSAGTNFARAGFRGDARSQFDWLLNNIKDAETLEKTRRELQKL